MSELSREAPTGDDTADEMAAAVRNWGLARVRPQIRELELAGEFPRALYREMGELGLFGCWDPVSSRAFPASSLIRLPSGGEYPESSGRSAVPGNP